MITLSPKMASFRFIYRQLSRMVKTWGISPEFSISNQLDLCSVLFMHPVRVIEPLLTGFQEAA